LNNPNNSPGYGNSVQFVFNMGGALGDSTWIEPGDPPTVAFHVIGDPFAPYDIGIVYVPGNPPQAVVDVIGSRSVLLFANLYGNNACFDNAGFTDVYTQAANVYNEGFEGLYPFATIPPVQAGPWEWLDSATVVTEANAAGQPGAAIYQNFLFTNPDMSKAKAMAYIDTVMGYLNPRIVYCLNLTTGISTIEIAEQIISVTPNPVSDVFHINVSELRDEVVNIHIYDITGKIVKSIPASGQSLYTLSRTGMNSGTYIVKVILKNGTVNKKVILD
jgi:hypothetical protein